MRSLICGSLAYDNIMVFSDHFKNHILPDKIHILNVSFLVPEMRREFGGCSGNIAYNLKGLGGDPLIMATAGQDFGPYALWLDKWNINRDHIKILDDHYTAQAFITTDLDDNQITAFHPGAMGQAHQNKVADAGEFGWAIVSPDGRDAMLQHAHDLAAMNKPFIFDPGQGLPMFDGNDLLAFIDKATILCVNDYESQLVANKTGIPVEKLAERLDALIITRGGEGSRILHSGKETLIPSAQAEQLCDPTGCGDAYRAGLLYGLERGMDWDTTGRIAALLGAIKISCHGTQNHQLSPESIGESFKKAFGYDFA